MKSLKGKLLLASNHLLDPNFIQSVVLVVQHDKNGALGLVLNRPADLTVKEAWEQVSQTPCKREDHLYVGGPCEGVLMALHPCETVGQLEVVEGLYFSTETKNIEWLMRQDPRKQMRFFVGYSGWSPGQLEKEMESGSWLTAEANLQRVFSDEESLWRQVKRELAYTQLAGQANPKIIPDNPNNN